MKNEILELLIRITGEESLLSNPDIDLIETNILDSLAFITLVSQLEEKYKIEIETTEIPYNVWTSVEKIANMVVERQKKL